mmetsp:Transcript_8327/g.25228  ORF Transcript_8327/g.25228 Transcript_8327/m.25228 type:complete len:243 (-) Transcript_8327:279-1007(-)
MDSFCAWAAASRCASRTFTSTCCAAATANFTAFLLSVRRARSSALLAASSAWRAASSKISVCFLAAAASLLALSSWDPTFFTSPVPRLCAARGSSVAAAAFQRAPSTCVWLLTPALVAAASSCAGTSSTAVVVDRWMSYGFLVKVGASVDGSQCSWGSLAAGLAPLPTAWRPRIRSLWKAGKPLLPKCVFASMGQATKALSGGTLSGSSAGGVGALSSSSAWVILDFSNLSRTFCLLLGLTM